MRPVTSPLSFPEGMVDLHNPHVSTEQRLAVAGADLYYDIEGEGPTLVLVHGFTLDGRMWDEQVVALRDVATVVRCDLRGFGRSSEPEAGIPYTHTADLLALLDHLGIDSAMFVGLSMGGRVVLETALVAPERVRGLVLLDSVLNGVEWDAEAAQGMEDAERTAKTQGMAAARAIWLRHPLFAPACRDAELSRRLAALVEPYSGFHWTHEDPQARTGPDPIAMLEQIGTPTTVVVGDLDVPCFLTMADMLARRIPGAHRIDVPDSGHMVNLEAPDAVNALLRKAILA